MGFLQRWLDEPDERIAANARTFYAAALLFMGAFALQMAQAVWRAGQGEGDVLDLAGPVVSAFLALALYGLALDGRRSYKAVKAARDAQAPPP